MEFLYTAGQQRLCKIVKPHEAGGTGISDQDQWIYYWYSYDAGGNLMGVYKQSFRSNGGNDYTVMIDLQEHDVFGSGRTGIRHADDESDYYQDFTATKTGGLFSAHSYTGASSAYSKTHYTRTIGYKQYEIANHLGNVLVTISDKRLLYSAGVSPTEVDWYVPDVQSYSDYYVFGAPLPGRAGGSYRFGFNGCESDPEIKNEEGLSYTTEFRQYDPRVGRWMSPDPIVKPWESPYAGFANNPVLFVDPSGLTPSTGGGDPPKEEPVKEKKSFLSRFNNAFSFLRFWKKDAKGSTVTETNYYSSLPNPDDFDQGEIIYVEPEKDENGKPKHSWFSQYMLDDGKWVLLGYNSEVMMNPVVISEKRTSRRGPIGHKRRNYTKEEREDFVFRSDRYSEYLRGVENPYYTWWDPTITQEEGAQNAWNTGLLLTSFNNSPLVRSAAAVNVAKSGTSAARSLGIAGEQAVGTVGSKVRIPSLTGTAAYRIPDQLTSTTLIEVKNVSSLSLTNQIKDFSLYAQATGRQLVIYTRATTTFTGPLQQMIDAGTVIIKTIPF